jgi:hypothetical protein
MNISHFNIIIRVSSFHGLFPGDIVYKPPKGLFKKLIISLKQYHIAKDKWIEDVLFACVFF